MKTLPSCALDSTSKQLTLVAFYGEKERVLADLVEGVQRCLADQLGSRFAAYEPEQVHATIAGLEGVRVGEHVVNSNFVDIRREVRVMNFSRLFATLEAHLPLEVRLGGFTHGQRFPFQSQGLHPYLRSFMVRGRIAVAMGWPSSAGAFPQSLDSLRRRLNDAGVLHKYHGSPSDVDNDLFFALGRVEEITESERELAQSSVRELLAKRDPIHVTLSDTQVSLVAYDDPQLPRSSSEQISIEAATSDVSSLVGRYPEAAG
jgi:hypothetical protein